jgi:hypothetical protein
MTTRTPSLRRDASAAGVVALIGSVTAMTPAALPSTVTNSAVAPSVRNWSAAASSGPSVTPASSMIRRLPTTMRRPATSPMAPLPAGELKSRGSDKANPRARAASTMAAASG